MTTLKSLIEEQTGINKQGWKKVTQKIASRVERKSEKSKQACSSIRDFRVRGGRGLKIADFETT